MNGLYLNARGGILSTVQGV
uniref:Uncharacterized protein n=1 Tax=Arundo donax TaxID=35708 RepID=A0A0A9AXA9_ARUDO